MIPPTDCSFALLLIGFGLIYLEVARPGLYLPAILGVGLVLASLYWLAQRSPSTSGLLLAGSSALLFCVEALYPAHKFAGLLATITLIWAAIRLFAGPDRLSPALAIPLSILFGAATTFLAQAAQRARTNKRLDV